MMDVWVLVGCPPLATIVTYCNRLSGSCEGPLLISSGFKGPVVRGWVTMGGAGGHGYVYFEIPP